jgi:hypothetical protein
VEADVKAADHFEINLVNEAFIPIGQTPEREQSQQPQQQQPQQQQPQQQQQQHQQQQHQQQRKPPPLAVDIHADSLASTLDSTRSVTNDSARNQSQNSSVIKSKVDSAGKLNSSHVKSLEKLFGATSSATAAGSDSEGGALAAAKPETATLSVSVSNRVKSFEAETSTVKPQTPLAKSQALASHVKQSNSLTSKFPKNSLKVDIPSTSFSSDEDEGRDADEIVEVIGADEDSDDGGRYVQVETRMPFSDKRPPNPLLQDFAKSALFNGRKEASALNKSSSSSSSNKAVTFNTAAAASTSTTNSNSVFKNKFRKLKSPALPPAQTKALLQSASSTPVTSVSTSSSAAAVVDGKTRGSNSENSEGLFASSSRQSGVLKRLEDDEDFTRGNPRQFLNTDIDEQSRTNEIANIGNSSDIFDASSGSRGSSKEVKYRRVIRKPVQAVDVEALPLAHAINNNIGQVGLKLIDETRQLIADIYSSTRAAVDEASADVNAKFASEQLSQQSKMFHHLMISNSSNSVTSNSPGTVSQMMKRMSIANGMGAGGGDGGGGGGGGAECISRGCQTDLAQSFTRDGHKQTYQVLLEERDAVVHAAEALKREGLVTAERVRALEAASLRRIHEAEAASLLRIKIAESKFQEKLLAEKEEVEEGLRRLDEQKKAFVEAQRAARLDIVQLSNSDDDDDDDYVG